LSDTWRPRQRPCIGDAKSQFIECRGQCKEDYQAAKDACLNRDHECVEVCRARREECRLATGIDADLAACDATLRAAKQLCRENNARARRSSISASTRRRWWRSSAGMPRASAPARR
jgi:hypothetical protein